MKIKRTRVIIMEKNGTYFVDIRETDVDLSTLDKAAEKIRQYVGEGDTVRRITLMKRSGSGEHFSYMRSFSSVEEFKKNVHEEEYDNAEEAQVIIRTEEGKARCLHLKKSRNMIWGEQEQTTNNI